MLPVHTILFPTDLSQDAQSLFGLACSLARDNGARLVVLYVLPPPVGDDIVQSRQHPEEYYEGPRGALHQMQAPDQNVRVEHRLEEGDAASLILEVAQQIDAGLIIMGTHGRSGVMELLLGSVAAHVLRKATCPVLTVRMACAADETKHAALRRSAT